MPTTRLVVGSREAVLLLQEHPWDGIDTLLINYENFSAQAEEEAVWFNRLAPAIESNHQLKTLFFLWATMDRSPTYEGGLTQLLQTALPSHPSLKHVNFQSCKILPHCLEMLVSSVVRHPRGIQALSFFSTPLDAPDSTDVIATLLRESSIEELHLDACDLDATACQKVFAALDGNSALRELRVLGNNGATIDAVGAAAICRTRIARLRVADVHFTASAVRTLAHGLRSNDSLESLDLASCGGHVSPSDLEDLLRMYNVTLRAVRFESSTPDVLRPLLEANERIRSVHAHLLFLQHRLPHLSLWPRTLAILGSKPSLLFGFLRQRNVELLCQHLQSNRRSGRRRDHPQSVRSRADD